MKMTSTGQMFYQYKVQCETGTYNLAIRKNWHSYEMTEDVTVRTIQQIKKILIIFYTKDSGIL